MSAGLKFGHRFFEAISRYFLIVDNSWTGRDAHLQKVIRLDLTYHKIVSSGHAERLLTERVFAATNKNEFMGSIKYSDLIGLLNGYRHAWLLVG